MYGIIIIETLFFSRQRLSWLWSCVAWWHQDDVIKWKQFPRYWPFVRGNHRSTVNSPRKGPVTRSFDVFCDLCLNKWLSKQSWGWWFETPSRSLWRHCNVLRDSTRFHATCLEMCGCKMDDDCCGGGWEAKTHDEWFFWVDEPNFNNKTTGLSTSL